MTRIDGITKATLAQIGVAWPDKHPDSGEPFVDVEDFRRESQREQVHHLPIGYPSRMIATAWETVYVDEGDFCDEYEREIEWRDLTDEEWAAALAHYEKHKHETFGFVSTGPDIIEGRFVAASGSWAKGMWDGKGWSWIEYEAVPMLMRRR